MRFISCASYYGSGSSAITDFVSEFDTVYSFTDEEFRFVQDPDGVSDLEYNLVENFNRHNSGHAIKRYKKLVDFESLKLLDEAGSSRLSLAAEGILVTSKKARRTAICR